VSDDHSRKYAIKFLVFLLIYNLLISIDVPAFAGAQASSDCRIKDDVLTFANLQIPDAFRPFANFKTPNDDGTSIDVSDSSVEGMIMDIGPSFCQACRASFIAAGQPGSHARALALNHPPQIPSTPTGPSTGLPGTAHNYSTASDDPDADKLTYLIDWGDRNTTFAGPLNSGETVAVNHTWCKGGVYLIKAIATDSFNSSSAWSGALRVVINTPPDRPPKPTGPATGRPKTSYSFRFRANDRDNDRTNLTVDWGDNCAAASNWTEPGREVSLAHAWERAGTYRIRAMAMDNNSATSAWSNDAVIVINSPPDVPSAPTGPSFGFTGDAYGFLASSTDPDGDRITLIYEWGDGNASVSLPLESGAETRVDHAWNKAGTYHIRVSAADSLGASSPWSRSLNITINTPPQIPSQPSGPSSGFAWAPYRYIASASDPDRDSLSYTFDWGDGTQSKTDFLESGERAALSHVWNKTGSYRILVDATDSKGTRANWSEPLNVTIAANDLPEMPRDLYGLGMGYTGVNYTYFTMAEDSNGDDIMYAFDWGDFEISLTGYVKSGSIESASHIWKKAGEYVIRANATDAKGAPSEWSEPFAVVIKPNKPPKSPKTPSGPSTGWCQKASRYSTSASDPDGDPVRYVFDWDDGTTTWTGMDYIDSGKESGVSHKWTKPGTYRVKATAMDNKGTTSDWSKALAVKIE